VKKPQLILALAGISLVVLIYFFGQFKPEKVKSGNMPPMQQMMGEGAAPTGLSTDTLLIQAKAKLGSNQLSKIEALENQAKNGTDKNAQLAAYHKITHFWRDSAQIFEPYAWYEAEAARLENSEKSLTFAARLFLDDLQSDDVMDRRIWKALQAKDLFERSLKLNPENDSAKVGLGSCYLFGNISQSPMEGIAKIREVVQKDSNNVYAQITLVKGALISGQFDKGIERLKHVYSLQPNNVEAILLMAELYERSGDKAAAISWYQKSLVLAPNKEIKAAITQRIEQLKH
jgi:tetratricopeptide (TPR) repeat protein